MKKQEIMNGPIVKFCYCITTDFLEVMNRSNNGQEIIIQTDQGHTVLAIDKVVNRGKDHTVLASLSTG